MKKIFGLPGHIILKSLQCKNSFLLAFFLLLQPSPNAFCERVCQGDCASAGQGLKYGYSRFFDVSLRAGVVFVLSTNILFSIVSLPAD